MEEGLQASFPPRFSFRDPFISFSGSTQTAPLSHWGAHSRLQVEKLGSFRVSRRPKSQRLLPPPQKKTQVRALIPWDLGGLGKLSGACPKQPPAWFIKFLTRFGRGGPSP